MLPAQYLQSIQSICPFVIKEPGGKFVQTVKAQSDYGKRQHEQDYRRCRSEEAWFSC